ncbi:response regulator [Pleurocapsales cyanobacterium LEGE 06147]|nr:response regulator [Pleurocapsales cyanobacterium LEGE 06147]
MSKFILVVDDEEDVRAIAKLGLEMAANWQVLIASSGKEAVDLAQTHQPDLILLDLMMPDWDGRTTLAKLKTNPATKAIPVILMTAKTQQSTQEELAELDVVAVFTKPFRPLQLPAQIKEVLGK